MPEDNSGTYEFLFGFLLVAELVFGVALATYVLRASSEMPDKFLTFFRYIQSEDPPSSMVEAAFQKRISELENPEVLGRIINWLQKAPTDKQRAIIAELDSTLTNLGQYITELQGFITEAKQEDDAMANLQIIEIGELIDKLRSFVQETHKKRRVVVGVLQQVIEKSTALKQRYGNLARADAIKRAVHVEVNYEKRREAINESIADLKSSVETAMLDLDVLGQDSAQIQSACLEARYRPIGDAVRLAQA